MHPKIKGILTLLSVAVVVAGLFQSAAAEKPQRLAGSYVVKNVVADGEQVHLTITMTITNPSAQDIKGSIVALLDSQPESGLLGSFGTLKLLPHLGQAAISQTFSVSAKEYANWQHGHEPRFQFLQSSDAGAVPVLIQARRVVTPGESAN